MYRYNVIIICALTFVIAACAADESPTPVTLNPTSTQTKSPTSTPVPLDPTDTPLPTATSEPQTLTICLGAEPDTLWLYGGQMLVKKTVLEAIYDGPIDILGFAYQPVILEKLPSLEDNDAWIEAVSVDEGD